MNVRPLRTTTVAALTAASVLASTFPFAQVRAQDEQVATQIVGVARLSPESEAAITKGLAYLAKDGVQNPDGSWGGLETQLPKHQSV